MAYVAGFDNDIFISYAHGDDRAWIRNFFELLKPALKEQLGVAPNLWIDEATLGRSEDFRSQIPQDLESSALLLLLASPQYLQSSYCVNVECAGFAATVAQKRRRFNTPELQNQLFAFRVVMVPAENNEHRALMEGATDYTLHDGAFPVPILRDGAFEPEFRRLVRDISSLLRRLRNMSTPVFVYPRDPNPDIAEAHQLLTQELTDSQYRIAPDNLVGIEQKMHESALSVFLVGTSYDARMRDLTAAIAARKDRPWIVWESPAAGASEDPDQMMFLAYLESLPSSQKRFFNSRIRPDQLKREVMDLLRPASRVVASPGKPRIALVYDARKRSEIANAGQIRFRWDRDFDFELPVQGSPARPANADAALLVWGQADESWCSDQFERLQSASLKGLCVFDPEKRTVIDEIRRSAAPGWHIIEQYGGFDPGRLDSFFQTVR